MDQQPLINIPEYKQSKRRRKRRDLDKLLNGRSSRMRRKNQHELLQMCSDSNSSDDYTRSYSPNTNQKTCPCTAYLMYLNLTFSLAACVGCALLLWLFFVTRQDVITSKNGMNQDESNIKELLSTYHKTKSTLADLKNNFTTCSQTTDDLKSQIKSLTNRWSEFSSSNKKHSNDVKLLPQEVKNLKIKCDSTSDSVSQLKRAVEDVNSLVKSMKLQIGHLEKRSNVSLTSLTKLISILPTKLNHLIVTEDVLSTTTINSEEENSQKRDAYVLSQSDMNALIRLMKRTNSLTKTLTQVMLKLNQTSN